MEKSEEQRDWQYKIRAEKDGKTMYWGSTGVGGPSPVS